jgi:hypothetical protein
VGGGKTVGGEGRVKNVKSVKWLNELKKLDGDFGLRQKKYKERADALP